MDNLIATQELAYGGKTYHEGDKFECDAKYTKLLIALGKAEKPKRGRPAKDTSKESPEDSGENEGSAVPAKETSENEPVDEEVDKEEQDKKLKDKRAKKYETRVMTAES